MDVEERAPGEGSHREDEPPLLGGVPNLVEAGAWALFAEVARRHPRELSISDDHGSCPDDAAHLHLGSAGQVSAARTGALTVRPGTPASEPISLGSLPRLVLERGPHTLATEVCRVMGLGWPPARVRTTHRTLPVLVTARFAGAVSLAVRKWRFRSITNADQVPELADRYDLGDDASFGVVAFCDGDWQWWLRHDGNGGSRGRPEIDMWAVFGRHRSLEDCVAALST